MNKVFPSDELLSRLDDLEKLRNRFTYDYSKEAIMKLTLDGYCEHEGDKNNFCYRLEHELEGLGHINIYASAFGVKYDKELNAYRGMKKFSASENPDEALELIKSEIVKLISAGAEKDYQSIRDSMISPNIRFKILSVYYPEWYLPVFARRVLEYFCGKLNIPCTGSEDTLILQDKLLHYKNNQSEMKEWSLLLFTNWLYQTLGSPEFNEDSVNDEHKDRLKSLKKEISDLTEAILKASEKTVLIRSRDEKIRAYALERANGVCELCGNPAPFFKKNGEPYLESHHIKALKDGGPDSIYNVVGLCPNCHRKMHSLGLEKDIALLKEKAK